MKSALIVFLFLFYIDGMCCTSCNPEIQEAIFNSTFYPNLFIMLSAFFVLTAIVVILTKLAHQRHRSLIIRFPNEVVLSPVPLASASMVLGIGLGGFLDGIVLHQILQWHEMLSNKLPPLTFITKSVNMFWDGIFHLFCLMVVLTGVALLWKVIKRKDVDHSGKILCGGMLLGWGIFNIVEGVIDHHLLKLHNVKEASVYPDFWNLAFLGVSLIMTGIGYVLINKRAYQL